MVSYMPDQPVTELWMSVRQAICFYQDFYQDFDRIKASEMLQFMRIKPEDRVGTMSKGMSERLQLVLTMSRKARLYLLDEPIGGVDPVARDRIMDALVQFYNEDSSIILSTHLISNIERIFDEVIFIKDGQITMQDDVENIRLNHKKSIDELFKEVYAEC